ncbi:MAG: hypothetical protein B6I23_03380 [Rickettsiaceae bacterium 4572_127]|nr:MAG: hypothetical protein B6I23_03380 [Rickettsiaceae bacterium 4572_127]
MKIICIFGATGTGKTTFIQSLISTSKTIIEPIYIGPLVKVAPSFKEIFENYMKGKCTVDKIDENPKIVNLIIDKINSINSTDKEAVIIDGFPRTPEHLESFNELIDSKHDLTFLHFNEQDLSKIKNRIVCPSCKIVYNKKTMKPKTEGQCDTCQTKLVCKEEDKDVHTRDKNFKKQEDLILETFGKLNLKFSSFSSNQDSIELKKTLF